MNEMIVKQQGPDKIEEIASFLGFAVDSRKHRAIRERFDNGGICYAAYVDGVVASIGWAVFKRDYIPESDSAIELSKNEVILSDSYTSPIFRGQGLYSRLTAYMAIEMLENNFRVIAVCYRENRTIKRALMKLGFKLKSKRRFLRILGIRLN